MPSRIEDYAMIGDGRTLALVSNSGSIDWLCLPRFDSAACCAALLGNSQHGYWQISPCGTVESHRGYQDETLVLQTEFRDASGCVCLTDFMPNKTAQPVLIRRLSGVHGSMRMRLELAPRFDYGLVAPRLRRSTDALLAVAGPDMLQLRCPVPVTATNDGLVTAEFNIAAGDELSFVLTYSPSHLVSLPSIEPAQALEDTLAFWRDWASRFQRQTPWRDAVVRSLLTLKALSYHPTGALIAAGTTSLPETPRGSDNWDYRYCWLRDASFMLSALLNAGYREEATHWREWLLRAIAAAPNELRIMYRVDGDRRMYEQQAEWLPGYEGAAPVRVGNDAAAQRQIDVAGELLDALDLIARAGVDRTQEALRLERELVEVVERTWQDRGHGLWESRGRPERYTYSVVMAWVGVDRFLSGSDQNPHADQDLLSRLRALRARIHDEVTEQCWNFARGHFVDRYGGERLDASLLLLPLVNFLPADEPRMSATIDAIERELSQDGLVWRTPHDGDTSQGAFVACSCWLADCRALQGRRDQAVALLERVLVLRNDVGLLAEQYHPGMRRLMGNFPQALSHLAVINTALGLSGPVLQRGGG